LDPSEYKLKLHQPRWLQDDLKGEIYISEHKDGDVKSLFVHQYHAEGIVLIKTSVERGKKPYLSISSEYDVFYSNKL